MTGRRALVGLSLLCALAFTAFSAASASAATTGTTAVTCVDTLNDPLPDNSGDYTDEHCDTTALVLSQGRYKHVNIAQDTTTDVVGTNAKTKSSTTASTPAVLLATVGGVNVEISCTTVSLTGSLKNSLVGAPPNAEHKITTSAVVIIYTGCTVVNPAGCTVKSPGKAVGEGVTNSLKAEPVEGTPHTKRFSPEVGTEFIKLVIEGCAIAGTYSVTGTVSAEGTGQMPAEKERGESTGATLAVNLPKNASSTLVVAGQKAGLTQELTTRMSGAGGWPIATTGPPYF